MRAVSEAVSCNLLPYLTRMFKFHGPVDWARDLRLSTFISALQTPQTPVLRCPSTSP